MEQDGAWHGPLKWPTLTYDPVRSVWFISEWELWGGRVSWSPLGGVDIDGTGWGSVWPFEINYSNI